MAWRPGAAPRTSRRRRARSSSCARATSSRANARRSRPRTRQKAQVDSDRATRLAQMNRELDEEKQPLAGDRLFHLRIAEATGNGALVAVVKMLWEERTGPLYAATRAPLRFAGAVERSDGRAPRRAEGDRRARRRRGARRDAAASEPGVQALFQRALGRAALARGDDNARLPHSCEGRPAHRTRRRSRSGPRRSPAASGRRRYLRFRPPLLLRRAQRQLRRPRAADPGPRGVRRRRRRRRRRHARQGRRQGRRESVACLRPLRLLPRGPRAPVPQHALPRQREPASRTCRACSRNTS